MDRFIYIGLSLFCRQSYRKRVMLRLCLAIFNLFRSNALKSQVIVHSAKETRMAFLPIAWLTFVETGSTSDPPPLWLSHHAVYYRATVKRRLLDRRKSANRGGGGEIRSTGIPLLEHVCYLRITLGPYRPMPLHLDNDTIVFSGTNSAW